MTDSLLMTSRKQESRDALRSIYEKYRDSLLIVGIALSHDVNIAEDAVHDVFVALARNFKSFKQSDSLKSYLSKCVANRVRDLMRKKKSQSLNPQQISSALKDLSEPGHLIVCNEELNMLSSALAMLPYE